MKKFTIPCDFNGKKAPFTLYIGNPEANHNPVFFQAEWLSKERGGTVPPEVMNSLERLQALALKNGVDFEELCSYALTAASIEKVSHAPQKPELDA
jgi:Domain of unknown function (DUF2610)